MVKRQIVILIYTSFFFNACQGQNRFENDLDGSVWEKKGEFCSDSLHFYSDGKYQEYYCEFEQHMKGDYEVKGDTLTLVEYQLSSEVVSNNPKLIPTYMWKYLLLKGESLQKVYYEDLVNGEKVSGTETTWEYIPSWR